MTAGQQQPAPKTRAAAVKDALQKLAWLEGDWTGEGWAMTRSGTKETFNVTEKVVTKLGGLIIVAEGRGWSYDDAGNEVEGHRAFGVLSYEPFSKEYRFNAFVRDGYQTTATPDVATNSYRWAVPAGPGAEMRYHARLEDDGVWVESGERCAEEKCTPSMEMRLTKTPPE